MSSSEADSTASGPSGDTAAPGPVPGDRYGSARGAKGSGGRTVRGWRKWALIAFALVGAGVATYFGYTGLAATPIEGQRVAFTERPGNAMEVTIDVNRADPSRPAVCIVRVRDISGAESGRKEIYVPPGEDRLTTVVRSIGRPVTADMFGCSYNVPEYMSTP